MTPRAARAADDRGVTLVELMVAMFVTAILSTIFIGWVVTVAQVDLFQRQDKEIMDDLRLAKAELVSELRFAQALDLATSSKLVFWLDQDDDGLRDLGEIITWDITSSGDLTRTSDLVGLTPLTKASGLNTSSSRFTATTETVTIEWIADVDSAQGPTERSIRTEVALRNEGIGPLPTTTTTLLPTTTTTTTTTTMPQQPTFRVTTYELRRSSSGFGDDEYTLTLNQDLMPNYFVMIKGGAGNGSSGGTRGPDENFARVVADPFGTGDLSTTSNPNELELERDRRTDVWQGTIVVVESLRDHTASGFRLVDVVEEDFRSRDESESTRSRDWDDIDQVALYGGMRGGGVVADAPQSDRHATGYARIWPSGSDRVNLTRELEKPGKAEFTVYVVEWGSEWTIQRVRVRGHAGGGGMNSTNEYVTASINPVARDSTWVTGFGTVDDGGIGDGWSGRAVTLGNGVDQNATETRVAVGGEYNDDVDVEVYVHTHPDLAVDYVFLTDGTIGSNDIQGVVVIDAAVSTETYDNASSTVRWTQGYRFTEMWNSMNGTGNAFPRPFIWTRPTTSTLANWVRSRSGQPAAAWVHAVDFGNIQS